MKFLEEIQVRLDEVVCLGIAELLKSPSMGEFTRQEFVDGWKGAGYIYCFYLIYVLHR
jgi:DCN1-like protein 1/2